MNKAFLHLRTVLKHKFYVFCACRDLGITWRGITHDLSKFSPTEFLSSVKYYQGNRSPNLAEKEDKGYSLAWQHHKGHNTHHWQYWLDNKGGTLFPLRMPYKDVLELIADYVGASKAYNQGTWTREKLWEYWVNNRDKKLFHEDTYALINHVMYYTNKDGWDITSSIIKYGAYKY